MRRGYRQPVEDSADIVTGSLLRIASGILRYVRGWVASRIKRYAAIASRKIADLRFKAAAIVSKLVDEDDRRSRFRLLVIEANAVIGVDVWHPGAFVAEDSVS